MAISFLSARSLSLIVRINALQASVRTKDIWSGKGQRSLSSLVGPCFSFAIEPFEEFHRDIMGSCSKRSWGQIILGEQRELDSDSGRPSIRSAGGFRGDGRVDQKGSRMAPLFLAFSLIQNCGKI